ncbi:MAG: protein kinase [Anaerolineales bacterium]|nr:protein kinase [Anaerolineales bacterium]
MIGTKLGSYEIIEEIGKGGLATVYRAFQPNVGRYVAIKVLRGSFDENPDAVARFQREARMVARLEHIHILPVYDFDGINDPPYIVMRLLDGGTLKELLNQEPLTYGEIIKLLRQIASALDYAHRQGVIHRDIKPSNIMIDRDSNVYVTDFGLARLVDRASDSGVRELTQAGMVMGTPAYMAPEQGMGEDEIDQRADIYSLGVILYQMLTGELPFAAPTAMGMLLQHFQEPVPSAVERNTTLPPSVDAILQKAMAKSPADRYQRAGELIEALASAFGEVPETLTLTAAQFAHKKDSPHTLSLASLSDSSSHSSSHNQYKLVTLLYANFAEFAEILEMDFERTASITLIQLWDQFETIITDLGGKIFTRSYDKALALWGALITHEDDAERAIRAALKMQLALREYLDGEDPDEPLPMQMGINTGPILLSRPADSKDFTVSGSTTHIVQRLERMAPVGSILISHDTYRLVRGVFNFEVCDPLRMRGQKERIPTYLVRSVKPRAFRKNTRGVEGVETRMIGRKAEFDQLQELFYAAVEDRETQVVTIVSEPGLGKSRLLYEFVNWGDLEEVTYWVFEGRATPEMSKQPYSLLRDVISFRFEIQDSDSPAVVRQKMDAGIQRLTGTADERAAHFLGQLLGYDFSDSPHLAGVLSDAKQFQKQALYYLEQFFIHLTSGRAQTAGSNQAAPAVIRLEDLHWADESSLDAIHYIVSQNQKLPLFIVCLARPEFYARRPTWGSGQPYHTRMELRPLSNRESRQLVREILQKVEVIPDELRDLLVDRSEGNPFMMEELVKVLLEDRVIVKDDPAWRVELGRLSKVRVPPTLTGLIQVQLDSLFPPERMLLQRAAVIGRIFWDQALQALEPADGLVIDVETSLEGLVKRDILFPREDSAFAGTREFIFANQMLRDVVLESLLQRQRRAYHAKVAEWLIQMSGERADEYTATIAENFSLAGENEKAYHYLQKAGEKAQQVSAFSEALVFYEKARALLLFEKGAEALQVELEVRMGEILWLLGNYEQARQNLMVALNLARALGDQLGQANALYQLGRIAIRVSQLPEADRFLVESLALAVETGDLLAQARAHYGLGVVKWRLEGDFEQANAHYRECLEFARQAGDVTQTINALLGLGVNAMRVKDNSAAHQYFAEGQKLANEVGNQERLATLLLNEGEVWRAEGNFVQARIHYHRSLSIARIIGEPALATVAQGNLGFAAMQSGETEEAGRHFLEIMRDGHIRKVVSNVLTGLIGMAWINAFEKEATKALALLGAVLNHPAGQDENIRGDAEPVFELLRQALPENEIQRGLNQGKLLDFDALVDGYLKPN